MEATRALAITLSTPAGFMLMHRYDDSCAELNRAIDAYDIQKEQSKRPSAALSKAICRVSDAKGLTRAYRDALAQLVMLSSNYTVSRRQAIREINSEQHEMGVSCWLAPMGRISMLHMVMMLCPITQ